MDSRQTLWASAVAAIGASLCCVAPLVLVTLGLGGAWLSSLTRLEPVRPVFVVITLVLLGLARIKLYRLPAVCEPGRVCADATVQRRQRLIFWVVAALLVSLLTFPWYASLFYQGGCMKQSIVLVAMLVAFSNPLLAAQKTVTLGVPGMTCGACPITVKQAISRVAGVTRTEVDFDKRQAVVTYDDGKATVDQLMQATANAGYPASVRGGAQ